MRFQWIDYAPEYEDAVESWLDEDAVRFTGLDEGFREYFRYLIHDPDTKYGENFWVKILLEKEQPVGIMAVGLWENCFILSEIVIAASRRGNGIGSAAIREWIDCSDAIVGVPCENAKAVIFPSNTASQKAFEKAGFRFVSAHPDGDAWYYEYHAVSQIPVFG